jgi:hypothetical protein
MKISIAKALEELADLTDDEMSVLLDGIQVEHPEMYASLERLIMNNYDPTPYCTCCGSMTSGGCKCSPRAEND